MVWARFDDLRTGESWHFDQPVQVLSAATPDEVVAVLDAVENATRQGQWAYGFVSYEAATAIDPTLRTHPSHPRLPLAWFAVTTAPRSVPFADLHPDGHRIGPWHWPWSPDEHAARVAAVRQAIAAGDTYQCNLTMQLQADFTGDPLGWYRDLAWAQQGGHHAYLDCSDLAVVSASPESFLTVEGKFATCVPMKGTAPRSDNPTVDAAHRSELLASAKDAAENVMIVDLIRNDLSRIAVPGTVAVSDLLACEEFATVWQLTSTVTAELPADTGFRTIIGAMFPCGSITGAPKASTTALITALEDGPRGVYCGAIGWLAPPVAPDDPPRMRFNVAIRTGVVDRTSGTATYGVGGGITWSSTAAAEYAELQAKARILDHPAAASAVSAASGASGASAAQSTDRPGLIETFAVRDGVARHLAHHLARLRSSAAALGIPLDEEQLDAILTGLPDHDRIVRLELRPDGGVVRTERPLPGADFRQPDSPATGFSGRFGQLTADFQRNRAEPPPVRVALDQPTVDPADPLYRHKTTRRHPYEQARLRHPSADDVILVNLAGCLTETTIATIAVRLDGQWCTPPVSDGCLPGIGRELLLAQGALVERSIPASLLDATTQLALVSSVRGWRPAVLVGSAD